jgi:hypothetical protein
VCECVCVCEDSCISDWSIFLCFLRKILHSMASLHHVLFGLVI